MRRTRRRRGRNDTVLGVADGRHAAEHGSLGRAPHWQACSAGELPAHQVGKVVGIADVPCVSGRPRVISGDTPRDRHAGPHLRRAQATTTGTASSRLGTVATRWPLPSG